MASRAFKAGLLASGQLLTTMAGLVIGMVLSRVLSQLDYATYRQTLLAYGFLAPLLMLGLPKVLFVFIPQAPEAARRQLVTNLLLLTSLGALFGLALLLGGADLLATRFDNPQLRDTLPLLSPYAVFMFPTMALAGCLMAHDKPAWVAIFNVSSRAFTLMLVVVTCLIWPTPDAAIIATVVGSAVVAGPAIALMLKVTAGTTGGRPRWVELLAQVKFSAPLGVGAALGTLTLSIDKLIVSSMVQPEEFAIYVNGAFELPIAMVIASAVGAVLLPELAGMVERGEQREAHAVWRRSASKTAGVIFPTVVGIFLMAPEFITILYGERYTASAGPFRLYLLLLPARVVAFSPMFMAMRKNHLIFFWTAVAVVLNLGLSVAGVHQFGHEGAALATVVVFYGWIIPYNLRFITRHYGVPFREVLPWTVLGRIAGVSLIGGLILVPNLFIDGWAPWTRALVFAPPYVLITGWALLRAGLLDRRLLDALKRKLGR